MRFWTTAFSVAALTAAVPFGCTDLFHATDWQTACDADPDAPACTTSGAGGSKGGGSPASSSSGGESGGNGGAGGGQGGGTGGTGGEGGSVDCFGFCATVMANCTAGNAVYVSEVQCRTVCLNLPPFGLDTNSVECRTVAAIGAAADATRCPAAGPGGAGVCGANCDGFCSLMANGCGMGGVACAQQCNDYADVEPYSVASTAGDTVQCHLYYAVAALTDVESCDEASPDSTTCL